MKKIISLFAACVMILGIFTACGPKDVQQDPPATSEADVVVSGADVSDTDIVGNNIVNPMVESDAEGILNQLGFSFNSVEGAEDVKYFIVNGEIAEMQFVKDGIKFNARMKSEVEFTDISGTYYTWTAEDDCTVSGRDGKTMRYVGDGEAVDVCLWYDVAPGIMYSLTAVGKDLDGFDIVAVAEQVYLPLQGEVE